VKAVSDTGPINYLVQIGCEDLITGLFECVLIPDAVAQELSHRRTPDGVREWILGHPPVLQIVAPDGMHLQISGLGKGECAAIALARELDLLLLADDKRARSIARSMQVQVVGTLGILCQAHARGLAEIQDSLGRLADTTFHLTEQLVEQVIERAKRLRDDTL